MRRELFVVLECSFRVSREDAAERSCEPLQKPRESPLLLPRYDCHSARLLCSHVMPTLISVIYRYSAYKSFPCRP
jgi:hypothetical protein